MTILGSPTSPPVPLRLLPSIVLALAVLMSPMASAFVSPTKGVSNNNISSSQASFQSNRIQRKRKTMPSLNSRQREGEDLEDQLWSIRNSWKAAEQTDVEGATVFRSDVPSGNSNDNSSNGALDLAKELKDRFLKIPPPPEDQFIMTGDIAILFLYAFTSHSINDSVVTGLLDDPKMTIPDVIKELDPMHDVVNLQHPVWVDLASNPNVPFGNPSVDHALEVTAREAFLNHWGPLFGTEGSACVALCTCWLIAGWFHRAFLFDNSTYCSPVRVLTKTVETWLTAALLLAVLATGADWIVGNVPELQSLFCVTCKTAASASADFKAAMASTGDGSLVIPTISFFSLTQSDIVFIVDSLTILIAW
eukprot:CAMPEP_0116117330 /NCGR_PEP_ID=MMETSP0329-20121206/1511_1 /TAXON_ID=697910 /ORGANISM="Pseudo-nitzschia arenysensis, Strain B593" /LENGTH=362 /DNA_ID=CAMNT_0003610879 /DNA_START=304 /DNA_END=1389 /DNA_ORIENTATION=+